jgi:hypothetical protein
MKKCFFLLVLLMISAGMIAQNIGVGTTNPSEKLDVNGNLNIGGNLKVNGISGQSGQVLRTNSSGNTEWGDLSEYKNHVAYTQNGTWVVPAGVTKLMIEAWGGGGGGAMGGGGASGSYMRAINVPVNAGNQVQIVIGMGGVGPTIESGSGDFGGHTTVQIPALPIILNAFGGGGGSSSGPGNPSSAGQLGLPYELHVTGNIGERTRETYSPYSATTYLTVREFGNGGDAVMIDGANGGRGGFHSFVHDNLVTVKSYYSMAGRGYGAGGGGGSNASTLWGSAGGKGIVIIHY